MKKTIYTISTLLLIILSIFTACNTPAKNVENSADAVIEANEELNEANKNYEEDLAKYKQETYQKLSENEQSAANFRARIATEKKEAKEDYDIKIAELERRNSDMKKRMEDYKGDSKEKWESFKNEFNNDMNELGTAFKNLTVNNTK
jgi:hypothetical protein